MNVDDVVDFILWTEKTHPQILANLIKAYKKSKEMKK